MRGLDTDWVTNERAGYTSDTSLLLENRRKLFVLFVPFPEEIRFSIFSLSSVCGKKSLSKTIIFVTEGNE